MVNARLVLGTLLLVAVAAFEPQAAGAPQQGDTPTGWKEHIAPWLERRGTGASGLVFYPAELVAGRPVEIFAPDGFRLHMTKADDPGEEIVHAAGEPFSPAPGVWRLWIESEWSITPFTQIVSVASQRPRRVSPHWLPFGPGGKVIVGNEDRVRPEHELWVLRLGESARGPNEFVRVRSVGELDDGLLMPEGSVIAGLRDPESGRYLALSRPFSIAGGSTETAPLDVPGQDAAYLVLYARHPADPLEEPLDELALIIEQAGRRIDPDLKLVTEGGIYAVWYELKPGPAVLSGGDRRLYLPARTLELVGATIERSDTVLRRRPRLTVDLVLPDLPRERPDELAVVKLPEEIELAREELREGTAEIRIDDRLVHGVLAVTLESSFGQDRRTVDLTASDEAFVTLEPDLIEVYGTVRYGEEPRSGSILFRTVGGDTREAVADETGEYQVFSLQPLAWVQVDLNEVEQEPWRDFLLPPIRASRRLDLDIPDASVVVRVLDARTGEGIDGATVDVRNEYESPLGSDSETGGAGHRTSRALGQSHLTDSQGIAHLPSPRPGRIEISASAEDYRPLQESVVLEIADPPGDHEVELRLEPHGTRLPVRLTLPDGSPAAGAEVMRVGSISGGDVLFSGRADGDGRVDVPLQPPHGALLLRHPAAASAVVDWRQWQDEESIDWRFHSAAEASLSLRVLTPSGEPAAGATVCVWLGDLALSGPLLHWLWEASPRTDGSGFWTAQRLPRERLRILAATGARAGTLCALPTLATELSHPWPTSLDIHALSM